jgi:hypothetical protein
MLTSLGLLLATAVEKQGRAVGLSVAAFGALCFGWPLLVAVMGVGGGDPSSFLLEAPWFGSHRLLQELVDSYGYHAYGWRDDRTRLLAFGGLWLGFNATVTAALILRTLRTFDRRLGRIEEVPDYAGPVTVVLESGPQAERHSPPITAAPSAARQT